MENTITIGDKTFRFSKLKVKEQLQIAKASESEGSFLDTFIELINHKTEVKVGNNFEPIEDLEKFVDEQCEDSATYMILLNAFGEQYSHFLQRYQNSPVQVQKVKAPNKK